MTEFRIKAAVLQKEKTSLKVLDDIELPLLKSGQVLVKIRYAGLCHSQLMEVRGKRGEDKYLPHMLGHEGVGEVVDVAEGVTKVRVDDTVILGWIKGDGMDAGGSVYPCGAESINAGAVTTFSNYAVVSENRLVPKPTGLDDKLAVLFGCALPTGAGIVLNQLKPAAGSSVLVFGLGGIGLSALLALKHFAPAHIIAVDIEQTKLDLAIQLGATDCFLANPDGINMFKQQFPRGADYAVESAGSTRTIEAAFDLIRRGGGKCIFASHPEHGKKIHIDPFELICGKQLVGSWGGASYPDKDIPIIADIIETHKLPIHLLLSKEYGLSDINNALNDLEQRKIVRALIDIES